MVDKMISILVTAIIFLTGIKMFFVEDEILFAIYSLTVVTGFGLLIIYSELEKQNKL